MRQNMKRFIAIIIIITSQHTSADTLVYQCKMKDGHINFTDSPCKTDQKHIGTRMLSPLPETHTVKPQYEETNNYVYNSPRYESNELINNERRKEAKRDNDWNSLPPIGVTYQKTPYTYGQTHFR